MCCQYLKGGRVHRTTRWVQPSAMAWRKGTASKTAPSTSRRPLQRKRKLGFHSSEHLHLERQLPAGQAQQQKGTTTSR